MSSPYICMSRRVVSSYYSIFLLFDVAHAAYFSIFETSKTALAVDAPGNIPVTMLVPETAI